MFLSDDGCTFSVSSRVVRVCWSFALLSWELPSCTVSHHTAGNGNMYILRDGTSCVCVKLRKTWHDLFEYGTVRQSPSPKTLRRTLHTYMLDVIWLACRADAIDIQGAMDRPVDITSGIIPYNGARCKCCLNLKPMQDARTMGNLLVLNQSSSPRFSFSL